MKRDARLQHLVRFYSILDRLCQRVCASSSVQYSSDSVNERGWLESQSAREHCEHDSC